MDERLEKALDFSNYMVTLNNQKRMALQEFYQNSVYYFNSGQFSVTKETLSFCQMLLANGQEDCILLDDNDTPIMIENLKTFVQDLLNVYFSATNEYFSTYSKIKQSRSVEKLINE